MHPFFDKKAPPPPPPRSPSLVDHLPPGPGSSPLTSTSLSPPPSTTTSTPTILAPPPPAPAINAQAGPSSVPARSSRETSTSTSLLLPSSRSRRSVSSVSSSSSRRLLPPLPTAATPLPTFKLFDGEKPVQDKKENEKEEEEELTNAMKLLAFEFALPPSTFLSIHQAVQHAPNHEQGAQIAAMVLGNQEDGVKFALAVRTGELKGFMRGVTPQAYDTWRESRTFELSDQEGKERMKKGKKALQPAVQQEVINMLVAILPAPPSSPSSSSSEDLSELSGSDSAPPPKKKQKYEGSDGTSVLVKQSGSKGEIIVIKKPHMDKITITSTNVMSFNRRDRERYGDLVRDQTMEHRIATSTALPSIFNEADLAKFPLLSRVFDTSPFTTKITVASFYSILPQKKISIKDIEAIYPVQMDDLEKMWHKQGRIRDVLCLASIRARVGLRKSAFKQTEKQKRKRESGGGAGAKAAVEQEDDGRSRSRSKSSEAGSVNGDAAE